jgi:DNA-binding helix-hairpin-helix protein with protein kinase domain
MTSVTQAEVEADGPLEVLADGGEAQVLSVARRPGVLFKRYTTRAVDPVEQRALENLIGLPRAMADQDRATVLARTAWPTALVVDQGRVVGLLLPRAGTEYYRRHGIASAPKRVVCDWTYLAYRQSYQTNKNLVSDVPRLTTLEVARLVLDLATTMAALHRNGLVLGDVSSRNVLWTNNPELRAYVIDCDSFHPVGDTSPAATKQTPDWDDPSLSVGATTEQSDVYKLGLAAYRAVWASGSGRPPPVPPNNSVDGVPDGLVSLISRSTQTTGRPTAQQWVDELGATLRFGGRPVIAVAPRPAAPTPPPSSTPAGRPTIVMAPQPTTVQAATAAPLPGSAVPARPRIPMH